MSIQTLKFSSFCIKSRLVQSRIYPSAYRSYSSFPIKTPNVRYSTKLHPFRLQLHSQAWRTLPACQISQHFPKYPNQTLSVRNASTTSGPLSLDDTFGEASEIIASVSRSHIEPHIGFLKELGLDFGWGPTAFLEWSLEHVHVFLGTPWWATLAITTFAIRIVLFRTYIGSADNSARLATIKPHLKDIQDRIDKGKQDRDIQKMMQGTQEMRNLYASAGIKLWKNLLPAIQVPLAYGMFRLTRNMASLPVPGFEDGGVLWFRDLTVSDPFFLLPMITGISTFYMFKWGGEAGATASFSPGTFKAMQWGLPILSTVVMSFWPAAMQLGFAWTSILAYLQSYAFKTAWFRELLGIHPLPPPESARPGNQTKGMVIPTTARTYSQESDDPAQGIVSSATSKFRSFVDQNQTTRSSGRSKGQIAEARRYEEKRKKEIQREKAQAEQERQWRRRERREPSDDR